LFRIFVVLSIFFISLSSLALESEPCEKDQALVSMGWVQHSAEELETIWSQLDQALQKPSMKLDMEAIYRPSQLDDFVHFLSFDSTQTPQIEMFGDVAFYRNHRTQEKLEVRWYSESQKHFVHKSGICTIDVVPLAKNTLF